MMERIKLGYLSIINVGVEDVTSGLIRSEIRTINLVSLVSLLMTISLMLVLNLSIDEEKTAINFIGSFFISTLILVFFFQSTGLRFWANFAFTVGPAATLLMVTAYGGFLPNFHILLLPIFCSWMVAFPFDTSGTNRLLTLSISATILGLIILYIKIGGDSSTFDSTEIRNLRLANYSFAVAYTYFLLFIHFDRGKDRYRKYFETKEGLEKMEVLMEAITHNIQEGVFRSSKKTGLVYVNQAVCKIFGFDSVEEALNYPMSQYYVDLKARDAYLAELERKGSLNDYRIQMRRKNGEVFWASMSSRLIVAKEDVYIDGVMQDVSEPMKTFERVLNTKAFYEAILDQLPLDVVIYDEKLKFIFISKRAISQQGVRQRLIGRDDEAYRHIRGWSEAVCSERAENLRVCFEDKIAVSWQDEVEGEMGQTEYSLHTFTPLLDEANNLEYVAGFSIDITPIRNAQITLEQQNQELLKLNKELDRFVYSASHDLRAPIASVMGLIQLAEGPEYDVETPKLLEMMKESLARLDVYIKDIIDYSRNKRQNIESESIQLLSLVEHTVSDLSHLPKAENVRVEIDIDPALNFHSDQRRLGVVLSNLISNALRYSDPDKATMVVKVGAKVEDGWLEMKVEDNGMGIRDGYQAKVWEMFFRATSVSSGSGLGLYIVKETVEKLDGTVDLTSKEGEGTTITIRIPTVLG